MIRQRCCGQLWSHKRSSWNHWGNLYFVDSLSDTTTHQIQSSGHFKTRTILQFTYLWFNTAFGTGLILPRRYLRSSLTNPPRTGRIPPASSYIRPLLNEIFSRRVLPPGGWTEWTASTSTPLRHGQQDTQLTSKDDSCNKIHFDTA